MLEDGNIGSQALQRLSRLPDRLLKLFGCPDLLVTTNPAIKIKDKDTQQHFNYIRPLMTLGAISAKLEFPVWHPYGFNQSDLLVRDFLYDPAFAPKSDGSPRQVFVAWEHENIERMYGYLLDIGNFDSLAGGYMTVNGKKLKCETAPFWEHCDFDSIWFINLQNGAVCLSVLKQGLSSASYQKMCKPWIE